MLKSKQTKANLKMHYVTAIRTKLFNKINIKRQIKIKKSKINLLIRMSKVRRALIVNKIPLIAIHRQTRQDKELQIMMMIILFISFKI